MGRRGPRPTPTKLKLLRGTTRADRLNPNEPRPKVAIPLCPRHLQGEARRQWRRLSKELAAMGLLSNIDREALALCCQAWARWVEAEEALRKFGMMVKSPNGYPMQSPYLAVANKAMEQLRAMLVEFGMSPSSRTRVHAESTGPLTPFERYLRGDSDPELYPEVG